MVKLPDERLPAQTPQEQQVTTFQPGSQEELLFKKAIKGAAVRFYVELDQPLLRTNAPAQKGNRATILDLDLDKMIFFRISVVSSCRRNSGAAKFR